MEVGPFLRSIGYSSLIVRSKQSILEFNVSIISFNQGSSSYYLPNIVNLTRDFCPLPSHPKSQIIYPTSSQINLQQIPFPSLISLPSSIQTAFLYTINTKSIFQHVYYFKPTYNTQQRISMETDQDFKKQYQERLAIYSKRKADNDTLIKNIGSINNNIDHLTHQLNSYESNTGNVEVKQDLTEINTLRSKIEELENQIKQKQADIDHGKNEFNNAVSQLSNEGKQHGQASNESHAPSAEELNAINNQVTQTKKAYEEEAYKVQSLSKEISEDQHNLKLLEAELAALSKSESEAAQYKSDESNLELEKELKQLNKELESLSQTVVNEQKNADSEKKKLQDSIKTEKAALAAENNKVNELKQQQKALQEKLASNDNDKLNLLQAEVKKLETQNQELQKDIDRLTQSIETKKAEKIAQQEQLRKYKEKKEKNYKLEIIEAEKTTITLNKELQREKEKLAEVAKLSKSYVSQENLQILQKELNRHQSSSIKTSIETEENKLKKYLKENENLKTRIQTLKSASRKLEQQTESIVRTLKQAGDELVKEKLAQQKVFNQSTNKLNEYMKEYPDHEKKKEQQKLEEKKKRAEEKEKLREAAREEKERKKQEQLKAKQAEPAADSEDNPNLPAWEKWDKWEGKNLPAKDQTSIFNNRQFQLAAGAIALLAILLITFG